MMDTMPECRLLDHVRSLQNKLIRPFKDSRVPIGRGVEDRHPISFSDLRSPKFVVLRAYPVETLNRPVPAQAFFDEGPHE